MWSSYNLFSVIGYQFQKYYSESREIDTISRVHGELDELKNIMVKNIGELVTKCYINPPLNL
jgi:vesicle-associated membrane protein 7